MIRTDAELSDLSEQAARHAQAGDFAAAEPLYAEIADARPNSGAAQYLLGRVRLKMKRFADAREPLERGAKFLPREPAAHIDFAGCLSELGEREAALAALAKAERLIPDDAPLNYNKGRLLEALGRDAEAIAALDRALHADPYLTAARAARGRLYARRRETVAALGDIDAVLTERPGDVLLRRVRGDLFLASGDWLRGLADHEARLDAPDAARWTAAAPAWREGPAPAGRLMLYPEQANAADPAALRDTLMLMRGAESLRAEGHDVVVQCLPGFDLLPGSDDTGTFDARRVVWRDAAPDAGVATAAPLRSLPHLLGWTLDALPSPGLLSGIAFPDAAAPAGEDRRPPRRGLRRVPRAHVDFDPAISDPPNLRARIGWLTGPAQPLGAVEARFDTWLDRIDAADALSASDGSGLRALAERLFVCDVVVGGDTWPAHLAALLGVPVLMLLPRDADWLWGPRAGATPWYPTMELLREDDTGWEGAIARLKHLLDLASAPASWREAPAQRWEPGTP
ncbi:MAG: tetratricopeptide repeat protein [Alphaproteobacteria bacterium]|nr:tetratricopeptide repeat protein [Alphaproteobacteria bacterium]